MALEQCRIAFGEVATGRQGTRPREEKLDPVRRGGIVSQKPQRACVPPRRALRGTVGCSLAGLAQEGDGTGVAPSGEALDMVRAFRWGCPAARQRDGGPLVRAQQPAARCGVVPLAAPAGCRKRNRRGTGPPDDTCTRRFIDRHQGDRLDHARGGGGSGSKVSPRLPCRTVRAVAERGEARRRARRPRVGDSVSAMILGLVRGAVMSRSMDRASCSR